MREGDWHGGCGGDVSSSCQCPRPSRRVLLCRSVADVPERRRSGTLPRAHRHPGGNGGLSSGAGRVSVDDGLDERRAAGRGRAWAPVDLLHRAGCRPGRQRRRQSRGGRRRCCGRRGARGVVGEAARPGACRRGVGTERRIPLPPVAEIGVVADPADDLLCPTSDSTRTASATCGRRASGSKMKLSMASGSMMRYWAFGQE